MAENLVQADFFHICPEGTILPFTRSLRAALTRDYLLTIAFLGETYIPGFSSDELTRFPQALSWVEDNLETFISAGFIGEVEIYTLPDFVQDYYSCLHFLLILGEFMLEMPNHQSSLPIAYTPGTRRWQKDIEETTRPTFQRLKNLENHPPETRAFDPRYDSTTKRVITIQKAVFSDWQKERPQASDSLFYGLLFSYWVTLNRRIKSDQK